MKVKPLQKKISSKSPTRSPTLVPTFSPTSVIPTPTIIPFIVTDVILNGISNDPSSGTVTITSGTVKGLIAGQLFVTNIVNFVIYSNYGGSNGACAVLNLEIAPISLNVLGGLHVDTTSICLVVTGLCDAGLLGDVLCAIAGGNLDLLPIVQSYLRDILTTSLSQQVVSTTGNNSVRNGDCTILNLIIGPVNLTILGLNVQLNNCNNGPVQVCLSATRGEGLLGELLYI
jgi:hypothetical protein